MGVIFDIQRFALHDGPGIRTTVFLKGCPLRCLWCHNPESQSFSPQYSFDYNKCRECLQAGYTCPNGVTSEGHDRRLINPDAICPFDAVKLMGEETTVERVLGEVEKDRAYYAKSGGGLTISGGEPMAQFDFCLALARGARERGLHVCLDTSGHAPRERFAAILPYVDLFLYDYKATAQHRTLTGVVHELVRSNLDFLAKQDAAVILRCPLVPGVNDTDEHLAAIADLARRYPGMSVELMAYHNMGSHKAVRVGQAAPLAHLPTADEATKAAWLDRLHDLGCTQARFG